MASKPIMQFYAELKDAPFPIWRRFQTLDDIQFSRLAYFLMTMFEMQANHLFSFEIDNVANVRKIKSGIYLDIALEVYKDNDMETTHIELPFEDGFDFPGAAPLDATEEMVKRHLRAEGYTCAFEYDFGDGWEVEVTLEKVFEDKEFPGRQLPRVLEGEGYGIIEDCGGVGGLGEIDKAFRKKSGKAYNEYAAWLGVTDLDLRSFDIDDMNFRLHKVPRIYKDLYEYEYEPTRQSMDILTRAYKK